MSPDTYIIYKIGGSITESTAVLSAFLQEFAAVPGRKILVHGGGKEATRLARVLGIPTRMVGGRRVTDAATLDVTVQVYAGLVNKRLVADLQALGCDAFGLCGADGHAIVAKKRNPEPVDFGFVGDISAEGVNVPLFRALGDMGLTPVVCAIAYGGDGLLLNCNADGVASALAEALADDGAEVHLRYLFELPGVLQDPKDPDSVIGHITPSTAAGLKQNGTVSGGMLPKVDSALRAVGRGVASVSIGKTLVTDD